MNNTPLPEAPIPAQDLKLHQNVKTKNNQKSLFIYR